MSYYVILIADTKHRHILAPHLRGDDFHVVADLAELLPDQHKYVTIVEPITDDDGDPAYRVTLNPEGITAEFEAFPPDHEDFIHLIGNIHGVIESPGDFGLDEEED